MRRILFLSLTLLIAISGFGQSSSPYQIFGDSTDVQYEAPIPAFLYVKNTDSCSDIKALAFDMECHQVNLLGLNDTLLGQVDVAEEEFLRWQSPDPFGQYHSPYLAMGNTWANSVDPSGGEVIPDGTMGPLNAGDMYASDAANMFGGEAWHTPMSMDNVGYMGGVGDINIVASAVKFHVRDIGIDAYDHLTGFDYMGEPGYNPSKAAEIDNLDILYMLGKQFTFAMPSARVAFVNSVANDAPFIAEEIAVHGNSLKSLKPTWGYKLYSNDGTFLKNGITSAAKTESRYTKTFMSDKVMLEKILFPNRQAAYDWEFLQNSIQRGPLNKNMH